MKARGSRSTHGPLGVGKLFGLVLAEVAAAHATHAAHTTHAAGATRAPAAGRTARLGCDHVVDPYGS